MMNILYPLFQCTVFVRVDMMDTCKLALSPSYTFLALFLLSFLTHCSLDPNCVYMTTCPCRCILLKKPVTQYNSSLESRNLIIFFLNENYECRLHAQEKKLQKYSILHSLICHQNQLQTNLGVPFLATPFCYLIQHLQFSTDFNNFFLN